MSFCTECSVNFDDIDAHNRLMHGGIVQQRAVAKPQVSIHPQLGPLVHATCSDMHQGVAEYLIEKTAQRVVELLTKLSEGDVHGGNRETRRKLRTVPKL